MALSTYSELQTAVGSWLNRSDLDTNIPDFIALAESSFNRVLRTRNQITRATSSVAEQFVALPSDLLELHNIQLNTSPVKRLQQVTMTKADELKSSISTSGTPAYFALTGSNIELIPTPDASQTLEIVYYATITALSDTNASNWLLTSYPDIYLYGTLVQAEPYLMNDERMGTWGALLGKAIEELRVSDERSQTEGGTLVMRASANLDYGGWK